MGRSRIHIPGAVYYVVLRAAHTHADKAHSDRSQVEFLFSDDADRDEFLRRVPRALTVADARLHAYCLMPCDVRLLIEMSAVPLGKLIKHLTVPYSRWRNIRRNAQGHVFQQRYASAVLNDELHIREVVRHIHRSPVAGNLATSPRGYLWSSHRQYLSGVVVPWIATHRVLRVFGNSDDRARQAYRRCMGVGEKEFSDYVIGDRPFMRTLRPLAQRDPGIATLEQVIEATCRRVGISPDQLASPSRARSLSLARALIQQATAWGIAKGLEVAGRLNRDPSSLFAGVKRYRQLYPELFGMSLQRFLSTRGPRATVLPIRRLQPTPPARKCPAFSDAELARRIQSSLLELSGRS